MCGVWGALAFQPQDTLGAVGVVVGEERTVELHLCRVGLRETRALVLHGLSATLDHVWPALVVVLTCGQNKEGLKGGLRKKTLSLPSL